MHKPKCGQTDFKMSESEWKWLYVWAT